MDVTSRLYRVLLRWIRYAKDQYEEWPERPGCGHFFGGAYWYGIESGYTALVFAAAVKQGDYDEALAGLSRDDARAKALGAIRYLCFTHDTGPEECVRAVSRNPYCSGKKWGGRGDSFFQASQTGTVIHAIGCAAMLLWEDLGEETKRLVETVLADYADRYSVEPPRSGVYLDTQCEENGWTAAGIGAAAALLQNHPRNGVWREAAERWAVNSVALPKDLLIRSAGVTAVTFHPDYTAENHAFVHPSYMMAGIGLRGNYALLLMMGGQQIPEALTRNNTPLYENTIKPWCGADGIPVPVQGQDWWYNRQHEALWCHTFMNIVHQDREAALLERRALEFIEKLQGSNTKGCLLEEDGEACIVTKDDFQTAKDMEYGSALASMSILMAVRSCTERNGRLRASAGAAMLWGSPCPRGEYGVLRRFMQASPEKSNSKGNHRALRITNRFRSIRLNGVSAVTTTIVITDTGMGKGRKTAVTMNVGETCKIF